VRREQSGRVHMRRLQRVWCAGMLVTVALVLEDFFLFFVDFLFFFFFFWFTILACASRHAQTVRREQSGCVHMRRLQRVWPADTLVAVALVLEDFFYFSCVFFFALRSCRSRSAHITYHRHAADTPA
jgi:hypothetical protein